MFVLYCVVTPAATSDPQVETLKIRLIKAQRSALLLKRKLVKSQDTEAALRHELRAKYRQCAKLSAAYAGERAKAQELQNFLETEVAHGTKLLRKNKCIAVQCEDNARQIADLLKENQRLESKCSANAQAVAELSRWCVLEQTQRFNVIVQHSLDQHRRSVILPDVNAADRKDGQHYVTEMETSTERLRRFDKVQPHDDATIFYCFGSPRF